MTEIISTSSIASSSGFTGFVLSRLRYAHAQSRAVSNQIGTIASALKGGIIGPEDAVAHLTDCDLVDFVFGIRGVSS